MTFKILGCGFADNNELGPFLREALYQGAVEVALSEAALDWERCRRVEVSFRGRRIGLAILDLVVEGQVILELKTAGIHPALVPQVIEYLTGRTQGWRWAIS